MNDARTIDLNVLVRDNILHMRPYSSARSEFSGSAEVFLDANENFRDFLGDLGRNRYPDPLQRELKARISPMFGIPAEQLFLGNGSDEAIDLLFRAFVEPKEDAVYIMPPTYGVYSVFAHLNDAMIRSIPLDEDFMIDTQQLLSAAEEDRAHAKLLFICSPNNPTGNDIPLEVIEQLLQSFPGIVVVDEAYQDFSDQPSALTMLEQYENLVVLKTFSKAWGLANARLGMAFACESIIRVFNTIKYPYNISGPAQETVLAALDQEQSVRNEIRELKRERDLLAERLKELPYVQRVFPSSANFLLVRVSDAQRLYDELRGQGIIIRNRTHEPGCAGCVRITVGSHAEMQRLEQTMRSLEAIL